MGGFCPGGFCPGGFCPRGDFVQGDFVWGILSGGVLSGGFCPRTKYYTYHLSIIYFSFPVFCESNHNPSVERPFLKPHCFIVQ